jgi:hypothetical protein
MPLDFQPPDSIFPFGLSLSKAFFFFLRMLGDRKGRPFDRLRVSGDGDRR